MILFEIGVGIIVLLSVIIIVIYNSIVRRTNAVSNAFSSIDVMLKKRYDLLPNLVEVTKRYISYEQSVLVEITRLRSRIGSNITHEEEISIHDEIQRHVNGMFMNVENYPQLKADQTFLVLMANWTTSEEHISASRRYYNAAVTEYNNAIQTFPDLIVARFLDLTPMAVLETDAVERKGINAKELFQA